MDLHPLHRTPQPTAAPPTQNTTVSPAGKDEAEPLEYTVRRMAQEIEALRLTAQYSQAKVAKYKLLQQASGESGSGGVGEKQQVAALQEKLEKYRAYIHELREEKQAAGEKLGKYKEHIHEMRAREQASGKKLEQYWAHIHELRAGEQGAGDKLDKYKARIQAHADSEAAVQEKLDRYRGYIHELKARQSEAGGDNNNNTGGELKLKALAAKFKAAVADCEQERVRFDAVSQELAGMKAELPRVKQLLRDGKQATEKLGAVTEDAQDRIKTLRQKLSESRADVLAAETKIQQLEATASSSSAKLVTSSGVVVDKVQACVEMLAKTHMVLHTCSQHLAGQEGGSEVMASALAETTDNVATFLQTLRDETN